MILTASQGRLPYWASSVASAPLSTYGASHLSNHRSLVQSVMGGLAGRLLASSLDLRWTKRRSTTSSYYLPAFASSQIPIVELKCRVCYCSIGSINFSHHHPPTPDPLYLVFEYPFTIVQSIISSLRRISLHTITT